MSNEILPALDGSATSSADTDTDEDIIVSDATRPRGSGAMEGFRPFDMLDLRAVGNPLLTTNLTGGHYQISRFLSSDKGHRHVTQLNPTPNSLKPLLDKIKEPSVLLLQGCDQLFLQAHFPFQKFQTLTALEISGCTQLTSLPEGTISQMTQLQTLTLSHLPVTQLPTDFFTDLTNLCSLVLRACRNLRSLPEFPKLISLECLDLSDLLIETLPGNFFYQFAALRWVILRGCSKLHSLPLTVSMQMLEVLDLSFCTTLKELEDRVFWHPRLRMLDLSHTALPRIPTLRDSRCLTHLFIRDTEVSRFYYLKRITNLHVLDLSGAQNVTHIDHVQDNKDLLALDLSRTGIKSIDFLSNLIHLRYLLLRGCTGLVKLPAMKRLTNLEVLDISGCEIIDDLPEDLYSLINLKELNLSGCSCLRDLRDDLFDHMSCLENLDLSETNVNHLPSFSNLANLRKLSLRGLELYSLESLASLSSLVELDLRGLKIRSPQYLSFDFLQYLQSLQILNLSQTSVAKLPDMSKLIYLKELRLANCRELKAVYHLQFLKNLEVLDLSVPDDHPFSNFEIESESAFQIAESLSALGNLRKLFLANRPSVPRLFPLESLAKLEYLDLWGTNETDLAGVNLSGMQNLQEEAGWDVKNIHTRLLQEKVSKCNELHLVSTFMSNSGFERFKYGFTKVDDLISKIQKSFQSNEGNSVANTVSDMAFKSNIQNQALKMDTDLRYILEKIDVLESSCNHKTGERLLIELMDAATHLSADDFTLDSTNLKELCRMVVKLKLLLPPTQVDDLEITKKGRKNESRFTRKKDKEKVATNDVKDPQEKLDLLNSYESLTNTEKNCLLCFSVFPCGESLEEQTESLKRLVIKKRILINWWFGEGFIDPQYEGSPKPNLNEAEKPKMTEETGKQILKVLEEKGFIELVMDKRRESGSYCMQPFVHSFVTARAMEEGFFDFHHPSRKVNPQFTHSQRVCLLKSQDSIPSPCKLWAHYSSSSKNLKIFKDVRTLFNVSEPILYVKSDWFSKMTNLQVLHLGNGHFENEGYIEVVDQKFLGDLKVMKQLRLLNLQGFSTIMKLPDSVCKLANLKILNLRDCTYLEELPAGIGSLKNLTYLDLRQCYTLYKLPKGLRFLSKLEVLKGFVITYQIGGKQHSDACTLRELSELENLRKLALVVNRDKFPDKRDLQAMKKMKSLRNLEISWEKSYSIDVEPQSDIELATLKHSNWQKLKFWKQQKDQNDAEEPLESGYLDNLQKLVLYCFPSHIAPNWLDPSKLHKLEKLYIVGGSLETLPGDTNQNTWNVKILRLKYLCNLYTNWLRLKGMFPYLTYFERHQCEKLTLFPAEVWTESDEKMWS